MPNFMSYEDAQTVLASYAQAIKTASGSGIVPHLIIMSETGESVVKAVKGQTEIIATKTRTEYYEYYECDVPEFGLWTIHAIKDGDDAQVTVNIDTVKIYDIDARHFHADIVVDFPFSLGATCRMTADGQETIHATSAPYTFRVREPGTYTVTATYNETDYTETFVIETTGQDYDITLPDPDDAPLTDISLWLFYGGIDNSGEEYFSLADVLADPDALSLLMASDNASDYMVRNTSWASDICANISAMTNIGLNNYCSDIVLADATWYPIVWASSYKSYVINAWVPTMTSDTAPEGEVFGTSTNFGRYRAFDGGINGNDFATMWYTNSGMPVEVGYHFTKPIAIKTAQVYTMKDTGGPSSSKIQGSNDGINWVDIGGFSNCPSYNTWYTTNYIANTTKYSYIRLYITGSNRAAGGCIFCELKLWGRSDV